MNRILRRRPSPALVISCVALFLAMGGVSYGLATGSIDSREIKNNTIRSKDVRNRGLVGTDIKRNRIGGNAIKESTLGTVPRAGSVDGRSFGTLNYRARAGTPTSVVFGHAGLVINATCNAAGQLTATAATVVNNAMIHVATLDAANQSNHQYAADNDFDVGQSVGLLPGPNTNLQGSLTYTTPQNGIVTIDYLGQRQANGLGGQGDCFLIGNVIG